MSERKDLIDMFAMDLADLATWAWAAGVLDGRGRWVVLRRGHSLDPRIELRVKDVRGRRAPLLVALQEEFNGSISVTNGGATIWQVTGAQRCSHVNQAVLPYLTNRAQKARAHQHICKRIINYKRESFEGRALPREERELRLELWSAFDRIP